MMTFILCYIFQGSASKGDDFIHIYNIYNVISKKRN